MRRLKLASVKSEYLIFSALHAKALYYQETLCKKEDIQRFLSTLVTKKPEVWFRAGENQLDC